MVVKRKLGGPLAKRTIYTSVAATLVAAISSSGCSEDANSNQQDITGVGGFPAAGAAGSSGGIVGASGASTEVGGTQGMGGFIASSGGSDTAMGGVTSAGGAAIGGAGAGGAAGAGAGAPAMGGMPAAGGAEASGGISGDAGPTGSGGSEGSAFPPASFGTVTGPFTAETITRTGPNNAYNVYHPAELGQDGLKHPVLTWGNGATTTPGNYPLLPALASHGFVVIAATSSFVNGTLLKDGLDWMLEQNGRSGTFEGKLDPDKVAAFGYSLGSLATFSIGTDPRFKTTVHISGGITTAADEGQAAALTNPTAYFCDRNETAANCDTDFAVVGSAPTFYGTVSGVHIDYMFNQAFIERFNVAVIAWFRWQLMGDETMATVFEGDSCTLCTDSVWKIQKKNMQ